MSNAGIAGRNGNGAVPPGPLAEPRPVQVELRREPLLDFLLYALYRLDPFDLLGRDLLPDLAPVEAWGHFPQYAAYRDARTPEDALALLPDYLSFELCEYDVDEDCLRDRIAAAAPCFAEYCEAWNCRVLPTEANVIDGWRDQLRTTDPVTQLQRLTRVRWPSERIVAYACYHHPSGSALTPTPFVFTRLFDPYGVEPSLPWFLGHEVTHLLLDHSRWWETDVGQAAIEELGARYNAEEPLCLVMQNRLTTLCGLIPEQEMQQLSRHATEHAPVYLWLQHHWDDYLFSADQYPTIVDYFLAALASTVLRRRRVCISGKVSADA